MIGGGGPARAPLTDLTIAHGRSTEALTLGGGVLCQKGSTLALIGCTLRDNAAPHIDAGGGGVFGHDGSTVVLTNCTLSRNEAWDGGAIKNFAGTLTVSNCTFAGNAALGQCDGIWTGGFNRAKTVVNNSLFADAAGSELYEIDAAGVSGDCNLTSDDSAPGAHCKTNTAARLGPLARLSGPTETHPLLPGSPALDAGDDALVPAGVRTDQRGLARVAHGKVDVDANEAQ